MPFQIMLISLYLSNAGWSMSNRQVLDAQQPIRRKKAGRRTAAIGRPHAVVMRRLLTDFTRQRGQAEC